MYLQNLKNYLEIFFYNRPIWILFQKYTLQICYKNYVALNYSERELYKLNNLKKQWFKYTEIKTQEPRWWRDEDGVWPGVEYKFTKNSSGFEPIFFNETEEQKAVATTIKKILGEYDGYGFNQNNFFSQQNSEFVNINYWGVIKDRIKNIKITELPEPNVLDGDGNYKTMKEEYIRMERKIENMTDMEYMSELKILLSSIDVLNDDIGKLTTNIQKLTTTIENLEKLEKLTTKQKEEKQKEKKRNWNRKKRRKRFKNNKKKLFLNFYLTTRIFH